MTLSDDLDTFQTYLEAVRAHPEDDELWEDLDRARIALEVAWLEAIPKEDA